MCQRRNFKRNFEIFWTKWSDNITYQNLCNAVKAMLRGKFIVLNTYIKEERCKINPLSFHLGKLEKEEQIKYKTNRRK